MSETQKFSISLPTQIVQRLDAMAAMGGQTRTDVVARLLSEALTQNTDALAAARALSAQLGKEVREGLAGILEIVQAIRPAQQSSVATADDEISSGALPPKLALLLVEIAARVTQKDPAKLEATRAAYRKTYLK